MFPIPTRIDHPPNVLLLIQTVGAVVSSVYHELFTIIVPHKRYTSIIFLSIKNKTLVFANHLHITCTA